MNAWIEKVFLKVSCKISAASVPQTEEMRALFPLQRHSILLLIILGLAVRLLVMFHDYSFDVNNHIAWAKDLHLSGFGNFYNTQSSEVYASLYPNYPPLAMYIFYLAYPLPKLIYSVFWWLNIHIPLFPSQLMFPIQERFFLAAMMKVPGILADFGIAWLVYLFVQKLKFNEVRKKQLLIVGPALVLLNPAFFYNSAYWGQIDAIPVFFTLLSVYLLVHTKRSMLSTLCFTLGLLVKPTTIVFMPVYLFMWIKKNGLNKFAVALLINNLVFCVAMWPFLGKADAIFAPYQIYLHRIIEAQSIAFVTNGAFNAWAIVTQLQGIKDTSVFLFGVPYAIWGYLITSMGIVMIIRKLLTKSKADNQKVYYALFLSALVSFLFLTKMHERYTMLILPFLLLAALKDKNLMKWYAIFSLLSFLNLYHSWPVPRVEILYQALSLPVVFSALAGIKIGLLIRAVF